MANEKKPEFKSIGNRGVEIYQEGKHVFIRLDMKAKGEPSSTGKMNLTANTGGFKKVEGTDFKVYVMAGYDAPK